MRMIGPKRVKARLRTRRAEGAESRNDSSRLVKPLNVQGAGEALYVVHCLRSANKQVAMRTHPWSQHGREANSRAESAAGRSTARATRHGMRTEPQAAEPHKQTVQYRDRDAGSGAAPAEAHRCREGGVAGNADGPARRQIAETGDLRTKKRKRSGSAGWPRSAEHSVAD